MPEGTRHLRKLVKADYEHSGRRSLVWQVSQYVSSAL
jgi:hypothetical protein